MYFNSRPSARGDGLVPENRRTQHISIHAPPRGATSFAFQHFLRCCISIHAPPRGATKLPALICAKGIFQFTPLREGRRRRRTTGERRFNFNSRPSARGDGDVHGEAGRVVQFQFTPLREGRPAGAAGSPPADNFNSRPSARGDLCGERAAGGLCKFQFTPLREGRRPEGEKGGGDEGYFNSRPSARGDAAGAVGSPPADNFNSRPSARGDRSSHCSP